MYAILMFLAAVLQSIILHQYFHRCFKVGMRMRTGIIAAVYRKVKIGFMETQCISALLFSLPLSHTHRLCH